jgi:two-component system, response regulator PdtaR
METTVKIQPASILVVEDDPAIANVLEEILTGKDYTVRVANNPAEAMAAVSAQAPDLVLMDINLSSDIDGIETARRLREQYEDLPVCFVTALSDEATVNRAEAVGPMAYLIKPFEMADVLTMVSIGLASARGLKERLNKMMAQAERRVAESQAAVPAVPAGRIARVATLPVVDGAAEDKLTGLPNRQTMERQIESWDSDSRNFVAVFSVDHVTLLRQRFGGGALDQIVFSYSQHLGQSLPEDCVLGRWDAATFVITPNAPGSEAQREVASMASAPMLYNLRLPGRSALLRVTATMRLVIPGEKPVVEQIDAITASKR